MNRTDESFGWPWRAEQDPSEPAEENTGASKTRWKLRVLQFSVLPVVVVILGSLAIYGVALTFSTLAQLLVPLLGLRDLQLSPVVERVLGAGLVGVGMGTVMGVVAYGVWYTNSLLKRILGLEGEGDE